MRKWLRCVLSAVCLTWCCFIWPASAAASEPSHMVIEARFDPSGRWAVEEAQRHFARGGPQAGRRPASLLDCLQGVWWLRIQIHAKETESQRLRVALASTRMERVDFYGGESGLSRLGQAGAALPMSAWTWPGRLPSLPLHLRRGERADVYVAARTCQQAASSVIVLPEDVFFAREQRVALQAGMLGGGLLALSIAVGAFAFWSRSRRLAALCLLAALGGLYELAYRGYGLWLLWPHWGEWNVRSPHALGSTLALLLGVFCWLGSGGLPGTMQMAASRRNKLVLALFTLQAGGVMMAFLAPPDLAYRVVLPLSLLLYALLAWVSVEVVYARGAKAALPIAVTMTFSLLHLLLRAAELGWPPVLPPEARLWLASATWTALISTFTYLAILGFWVRYAVNERRVLDARIALLQREELRGLEKRVQERTEALTEALQQTEAKHAELHALLGYIGHDLRAPLATIAGYVERVKGKAGADCVADFLEISRSVDYQLSLIDDLVHYSKGETAALSIKPSWTSLPAFLADLEGTATALCAANGNRYTVRLRKAPCYLYVDAKRLRQVLINLLSNAAKFTRFGEVYLLVAGGGATLAPGQRQIVFSVRDTGVGMAEGDINKIFQPYTTLNVAGSGSGLGLFITAQIAQEMGASLAVTSALGRGTRISLSGTLRAAGDWGSRHLSGGPPPAAAGRRRRPPAEMASDTLAELAHLARAGRYSDMLHWLDTQRRNYPGHAYLGWVQAMLNALDFEVIALVADHHRQGSKVSHGGQGVQPVDHRLPL